MQACGDLETESFELGPQAERAADGAPGRVEHGESAVASGLHHPSTLLLDLASDRVVVAIEQLSPGPIAELRSAVGGANDVGEQHRCEDPVRRMARTNAGEKLLDRIEG